MATGMAVGQANAILDAYCRSVAYSDPAAFYVQLHTAEPGAAGTTAIAGETDRVAVTFSAASNGAITNSADVTWAAVSNTETISHVSFWSASSGGTFLGSDALETARAVTASDDFTIAAGDIDLSLAPIAT